MRPNSITAKVGNKVVAKIDGKRTTSVITDVQFDDFVGDFIAVLKNGNKCYFSDIIRRVF